MSTEQDARMVAGVATPAPLLEVRGLARAFGQTRALTSADLTVERGEIHALVGENGSGKTTLIKILSGVLRPDAGSYRWRGEPVHLHGPRNAQAIGLATVFQETLVALEMSVRDSIVVGLDGIVQRRLRRSDEDAVCGEALTALGLHVGLDKPLWSLSLADRQLVTIARAAVRPWQVLILDEGTSALDANQRDRLFAYLRSQCGAGKAVLFTSHRMDEVAALADTVTVLRMGATVMRSPMRETGPREILGAMANRAQRAVAGTGPAPATRVRSEARPRLRATGLVMRGDARPVSVTLAQGEILGLAGLEGQGQVEFAERLCGLHTHGTGLVEVGGATGDGWAAVRSPSDAQRHGIAYVPRDRKQEGLFFPLSILDNFSLAMLRDVTRWGVLRRGRILARFEAEALRLRLPAERWREPIGVLSGGNQQKVLLARWVATDPRVLVLNDPMRGVDANTKEDLYGVLRDLANGGMSIVLVSTEVLELLTLCDRIAVFHHGSMTSVLDGPAATDEQVIAAMFGASDAPAGTAA